MQLNTPEIQAIHDLLGEHSDTWQGASPADLAEYGRVNGVVDPQAFAAKCLQLGIGYKPDPVPLVHRCTPLSCT